MTIQPNEFPGRTDRTIPVCRIPATTAEALVDRDGDVWRPTGRTAGGEVLLACDSPQDPADRGAGESFPWTAVSVAEWFGPLVRRLGGVS